MGTKNSKHVEPPSHFDLSDWVQQNYVSNDPGINEYGRMKTLKNRSTDELIDKYEETFLSEKDYDDYMLSYEWRRNEKHIVGAYYIESKNRNRYCSTTYHVDIYIEHPKNRLSDFSDVPFPDTMYCLKAMLIGYTKLFQHVGSFPVKEQQVCIDEQGTIKVWLNKDLSKNYPEEWQIEPKSKSIQQEEQEMVSQIILIVDKNTDPELERKPTFIQFYEQNKNVRKIGFEQALLLVEQYTESNDAAIPEYFISVMQVYEHQQGLYQADMEQQSNSRNDENADQFGEMTEREIERRRNQLFGGSQVEKLTNNSRKSSQIQNLEKYSSNQLGIQNQGANNLSNSLNSNKNKGETYRLSGLSKLDDSQKIVTTYQPLKNYNPVNNVNGNNIYRPSEALSNINNYSQISYNNAQIKPTEAPVWVSHKPQQAYIPSSPTYLNLQPESHQNHNGLLGQLSNAQTVRTQNTHKGEEQILGRNYSISEKQQENNNSNMGEDYLNLKFERELEEQIEKDQHEIESREQSHQQLQYKPLPKRSSRQGSSHVDTHPPVLNQSESESFIRKNHNEAGNQQTAQFIRQSSNYRLSHPQANSVSGFASISKSNSAQGFTIIIKSPSQQNISYVPHPQSSNFVTHNGFPPEVRMVKNNSQPYLPSYPVYQPPYPAMPVGHVIPIQSQSILNPQFYPRPTYQPVPSFQVSSPRTRPPELRPTTNYSPRTLGSGENRSNKQNSHHIETSYCTLKQEVPLDPEIANDLLLYI